MITRPEFLKLLWPPIFLPILFGPNQLNSAFVQWEYLIEMVNPRSGLNNTLITKGLEGWELCSKTGNETVGIELIFKRRL